SVGDRPVRPVTRGFDSRRAAARRWAIGSRRVRSTPGECLAVFALLGIVALEILVTYARLPAAELYHVSGTGVAAGFGRALVFLDFPVALAALALLLLVLDGAAGRVATAACVLAAALCAVVFWPGVVDQADLDARPVN